MASHKIHFPSEVNVWFLLPAIRKEVALGLLKNGMSQKKIAVLMNTSAATISHYKKEKRVKEDILKSRMDEEIKLSIVKIIKNNDLFLSEVVQLSQIAKQKGVLCEIYNQKATITEEKRPCVNCTGGRICL